MSLPKGERKEFPPENPQKKTFAKITKQPPLIKKKPNIEYIPRSQQTALPAPSTSSIQPEQRSRSSHSYDVRTTPRTQSSSPVRNQIYSTQETGRQTQQILSPPLIQAPDFNSPPYTSSKGRAFATPQYDKLLNSMDDRVNDLYTICLLIGGIITANPKYLEFAGLFDNILALGEDGVEEVRLSSYKVAWRLLIGNWSFEDLVQDELLIDIIKRNIRCSQQVTRLDVCCEMMLALGFTDHFLYE